jgi:hypothetical protein
MSNNPITNIEGRNVLSLDRIAEIPAFTQTSPHHSRSEKYAQIPTIEVVDALSNVGWFPVMAATCGVRKYENYGYQKHMVRLTNPDLRMGEEMMDILLYNSHDGSSSYQIRAGVYRFVCSNGLVVGNDLCSINVKHIGFDPEDVIDASFSVVSSAESVAKSIDEYKQIELSPKERVAFGAAAGKLLYNDNVRPMPSDIVTNGVRTRDNDGTLWSTYNTAQENWTKGRTHYVNNKGRLTKNRKPTSLTKNIKLNEALWTLTEEMAKLKNA